MRKGEMAYRITFYRPFLQMDLTFCFVLRTCSVPGSALGTDNAMMSSVFSGMRVVLSV